MSLSKYKNMIFDLLYIYFFCNKKKGGGDYVINLELKKEDENSYFNFLNKSNYIRNIAVF